VTVEVNTWLLIAKRHYKSVVLEAGFYSTWVVMRLIIYPYLVWHYTWTYMEHSEELGTYVNIVLIAPLIQGYLSCLNYWWTALLLKQQIAKRRQVSASAAGVGAHAKQPGSPDMAVRVTATASAAQLIHRAGAKAE